MILFNTKLFLQFCVDISTFDAYIYLTTINLQLNQSHHAYGHHRKIDNIQELEIIQL